MKLSDFDYDLPNELIAQHPVEKRDDSGLLIIPKDDTTAFKTSFYNLVDYLQDGDVIVFNNSKVIKAKLFLNKKDQKIQLYLNKSVDDNCWRGFAKPARKLHIGDEFNFDNHKITVSNKFDMGEIEILFSLDGISVFDFLDKYGQIPLPPYIKRSEEENILDMDRYQTIYQDVAGSVAAPTAGLHFTDELLNRIRNKNIEIAFVTLHVGAGTFLPVKTENIAEHKMHKEYFHINEETSVIINNAKKQNRRIIAVGTTTVRTLESNIVNGLLVPGYGETDIFIKEGFKFQIIDMLISNFHLPKSTLLMLVCAFAGYKKILEAYNYAINNKMRFFSYGDATLTYNKES